MLIPPRSVGWSTGATSLPIVLGLITALRRPTWRAIYGGSALLVARDTAQTRSRSPRKEDTTYRWVIGSGGTSLANKRKGYCIVLSHKRNAFIIITLAPSICS